MVGIWLRKNHNFPCNPLRCVLNFLMPNNSSSVFGGPTTRWELGGNPNQTMFSKPKPQQPVENNDTTGNPPELVTMEVKTPVDQIVSETFSVKPSKPEPEIVDFEQKIIINMFEIAAIYNEYNSYNKKEEYTVVMKTANSIYTLAEEVGKKLYDRFREFVYAQSAYEEFSGTDQIKVYSTDQD